MAASDWVPLKIFRGVPSYTFPRLPLPSVKDP